MKVKKVSCEDLYKFYRYWLEVICLKVNINSTDDINFPNGRQHHILTSKQMDLLAYMMYNRRLLEVERGIKDDDVLDQLATNDSGRTKIRLKMGITSQRMYELLSDMEKNPAGIITRVPFDNGKLDYYRINPVFMPIIYNKDNRYSEIMVSFYNDGVKR